MSERNPPLLHRATLPNNYSESIGNRRPVGQYTPPEICLAVNTGSTTGHTRECFVEAGPKGKPMERQPGMKLSTVEPRKGEGEAEAMKYVALVNGSEAWLYRRSDVDMGENARKDWTSSGIEGEKLKGIKKSRNCVGRILV